MMMDNCNTVYGIKLCIFCACMTGAIVLSQSNICVEISITYVQVDKHNDGRFAL